MDKTAKYDYSATQVALPSDLRGKVLAWSRANISREDLYDNDKHEFGKEKSPHITLRYGLHEEAPRQTAAVLERAAPIQYRLGKMSVFTSNPEFDVLKVEVESYDMHKLNNELGNYVKNTRTHPHYNPHLTIAYLKKGSGSKFVGRDDLKSEDRTASTVEFSSKNGTVTNIRLGSKPMNVSEKMAADINKAAMLKLEKIAEECVKEAERRHNMKSHYRPKKHDLGGADYAGALAGTAGGALMSSILKDIHEKPIELVKNRIYSVIRSAGERLMSHIR